MREAIAKNPAVAVVAVIVLVATWAWILKPDATAADGDVYFLDLDTKQLYPEARHTLSPAPAPSGAQGVRAHVFSCGTCTESERFIAFVEKFSDDALAAKKDGSAVMNPEIVRDGQLVSDGDAQQWVLRLSPAGGQLMQSATSRCDKPTVCTP